MLPYHMKEERPAKAGRIVPGSVKVVKPDSEYNTHPMLLPRNPFAVYPITCRHGWIAMQMGGTRLELVTSTMSTWRSNQLS